MRKAVKHIALVLAAVLLLEMCGSSVYAEAWDEETTLENDANSEYEISGTDAEAEIPTVTEEEQLPEVPSAEFADIEENLENESGEDSEASIEEVPSVIYDSHVQKYGWLKEVSDGAFSGTTGQSKRMEAVHIRIKAEKIEGGIEYKTHCQTYGWLNWVADGNLSGTTGQSKRMEAIRIRLTGELAEKYDVYYRVHAQTYGWLGWAKNGLAAGTAGYSKRLEAYEVRLVKKGEAGPESKEEAYKNANGHKYTVLSSFGGGCTGELTEYLLCEDCGLETVRVTQAPGHKYERKYVVRPTREEDGIVGYTCSACGDYYEEPVEFHEVFLTYEPYVEGYGWRGESVQGEIAGTFGEAKRLEGIKVSLDDGRGSGVSVSVHMQTYGWKPPVGSGEVAGNPGSGKRMEAIQISLTGPAAQDFDIYYRVHAQTFGWLDWAVNGQSAGSSGLSKRIEALEIRLVDKGAPAPGPTKNHFINYTQSGSRTLSSYFGISRQKLVSYLESHEHDSYYLGTPFPPKYVEAVHGQDYFNPKGDPTASGLARNPGTYMNCVGFVWHVLYKCGVSYSKIPRLVDSGPYHAWRGSARCTWPSLWSVEGLKRYYFSNKTELLASGILEKGDIIWCTSPSDCHILIFWGNSPNEDLAWHSLASGNKICCIHGADRYSGTWNVLKWDDLK